MSTFIHKVDIGVKHIRAAHTLCRHENSQRLGRNAYRTKSRKMRNHNADDLKLSQPNHNLNLTQPQLELELDLIMGRNPPPHPTPPPPHRNF